MAMKRPTQPTGAVPLFQRIAEQRILEAQRKGEFDNLPGKGKPLELEDLSWVPEELRKHVEDEGERRALAKSIQWKMTRLDMLKRRSMDLNSVRSYSRKLIAKFHLK